MLGRVTGPTLGQYYFELELRPAMASKMSAGQVKNDSNFPSLIIEYMEI